MYPGCGGITILLIHVLFLKSPLKPTLPRYDRWQPKRNAEVGGASGAQINLVRGISPQRTIGRTEPILLPGTKLNGNDHGVDVLGVSYRLSLLLLP